MPWGAIIGSGISAGASYLGGRSARKSADASHKRARRVMERYTARQAQLLDKQQAGLEALPGQLATSYDAAKGELAKADYAMRRRVLDQQSQLAGRAVQQSIGAGNFGSSAGQNIYQGYSERAQRQLFNVDATIGRLYAGLQERKGAALAAANERVASFYGQRSEAEYNPILQEFAIWAGRAQPQAQQSLDLGGLGSMFSDLFGSFGGGGGGAPPGRDDFYGPGF